MGKLYEDITPEIESWIGQQHLFFVATSPLANDGHVNCSPKGMDSFRILGPREVAYLDLTGSGAETIAHVRENGRIVVMFCAFQGKPKIVRFYGRGEVVRPDSADWPALAPRFPEHPGVRSIVRVQVSRISDSCGYSVPEYDFVGPRDVLTRWSEAKGPAGIERYWQEKNTRSIDGLPALQEKQLSLLEES